MATILVVEDNDDVREMMAVTLELEGHHAVTAANGREALDMLRRGLEPSLILLDLMMPVMNGWDFKAAVEADPVLRDIPIVVVSAGAGESVARAAAQAFVAKPIDVERLLAVVGDYCEGTAGRV